MFGFSFSELVVVILVAVVVMGPKDLPKLLRRAGQWAGKIRRAAADLRASSGIDEALRSEGLADDIAEIRKLARGELDAVRVAATIGRDDDTRSGAADAYRRPDDFYVVRDREYPREGADAYGALPDNAMVYAEGLPKSALHRDPLYVMGDETAALPELPPAVAAVGPTLMGIGSSPLEGVVDIDGNPLRAPDSVHDAVTATPGDVVPTQMGMAPPAAIDEGDRGERPNDDGKKDEPTSAPSHPEAR